MPPSSLPARVADRERVVAEEWVARLCALPTFAIARLAALALVRDVAGTPAEAWALSLSAAFGGVAEAAEVEPSDAGLGAVFWKARPEPSLIDAELRRVAEGLCREAGYPDVPVRYIVYVVFALICPGRLRAFPILAPVQVDARRRTADVDADPDRPRRHAEFFQHWADDLGAKLRPVPPVNGWRSPGAPERANAVFEDPAGEFWPAAERVVKAMPRRRRLTEAYLAEGLLMSVKTLQRTIDQSLKTSWPNVRRRLEALRPR